MAKAIVTQERVNTVADELLAAGEDPTILTVQSMLGGGSYSTVKRALDTWRAQRAAAPPPLPIPDEIQAHSANLIQEMWAAAVAQADQRVAEVEARTAEQVTEARSALAQAEAIILKHEREAEVATQRQAATEQQIATLQGELDQTRSALSQAEVTAAIADVRMSELTQRVADLRTELDHALHQAERNAELAAIRNDLTAIKRRLAGEGS